MPVTQGIPKIGSRAAGRRAHRLLASILPPSRGCLREEFPTLSETNSRSQLEGPWSARAEDLCRPPVRLPERA